jgi:hypothetical protein
MHWATNAAALRDAVAGDTPLAVGDRVRALTYLELSVRLSEPDDRETVDDDGIGRVGDLLLALLHLGLLRDLPQT